MRRRRRTKLPRTRRAPRISGSSARHPPLRPPRLVSFRSLAVRLAYACVGLALLGASYIFARPTFEPVRPAPRPWRLWLSTNARTPNEDTHLAAGWLLRLNTLADDDCSRATVTGALEWDPQSLTDRVSPVPARYVIAIAEARVYRLETRSIDPRDRTRTYPWLTIPLHAVSGAEIAEVPVAHWQGPGEPAEFRLTLAAVQPAGFESCYVMNPAIGDFYERGNADEASPETTYAIDEFLKGRHVSANLGEPLYLDAIAESEVPGQEPEDAAGSARLTLHPRAAAISCTTYPAEAQVNESDPYSEALSARTARPCESVQLFRSSSLQATLTKHVFVAGLLASAGITILVEALLTGVTDPPLDLATESRHRRRQIRRRAAQGRR
jgi:hypothetical protein